MDEQAFNIAQKLADRVFGEHTKLLTDDMLEKEKGYSVFNFGQPHCNGIVVAAHNDKSNNVKVIQRDGLCHCLIAGSTGSGKTYRFLMHNIMNLDGTYSVIISDLKGELFLRTSNYLKRIYGEENVKLLNCDAPDKSDVLYNPLQGIAQKYYLAKSKSVVDEVLLSEALRELTIIIENTFPIHSKHQPEWEIQARQFIKAICLGLLEDMFIKSGEKKTLLRSKVTIDMINFKNVYNIFHSFEFSSSSGMDDKGFFRSRDCGSAALQEASGVINTKSNTLACFLQAIGSMLSPISSPIFQNLTISNNFDVLSMGEKPQVLFINYSLADKAMNSFVSRYIVTAISGLHKRAKENGGRLNVPLMFYLDEFPSLENNEIYPSIFALGRSMGIYICAITQDFSQIESTYSVNVATQIKNNCDLVFFLRTNDQYTAEKIKRAIGKSMVLNVGAYASGSISYYEEYVVSEDTLLHRIAPGEVYICISNHMPVKSYFELYFNCEYKNFPLAETPAVSAETFSDKKYLYKFSPQWDQQRRRHSIYAPWLDF